MLFHHLSQQTIGHPTGWTNHILCQCSNIPLLHLGGILCHTSAFCFNQRISNLVFCDATKEIGFGRLPLVPQVETNQSLHKRQFTTNLPRIRHPSIHDSRQTVRQQGKLTLNRLYQQPATILLPPFGKFSQPITMCFLQRLHNEATLCVQQGSVH